MGHVYATVIVRGIKGEKALENVLVDTGSTFTVMPLSLLEEVGALKSPWTIELLLGDRRRIAAAIYLAEIELNGRKGPIRVAALEDAVSTIGVDTLETLGLGVNPITSKLEPVRGSYALFVVRNKSTREPYRKRKAKITEAKNRHFKI